MSNSPSPKDIDNLLNAIRNAETLENWESANRLYGELEQIRFNRGHILLRQSS